MVKALMSGKFQHWRVARRAIVGASFQSGPAPSTSAVKGISSMSELRGLMNKKRSMLASSKSTLLAVLKPQHHLALKEHSWGITYHRHIQKAVVLRFRLLFSRTSTITYLRSQSSVLPLNAHYRGTQIRAEAVTLPKR